MTTDAMLLFVLIMELGYFGVSKTYASLDSGKAFLFVAVSFLVSFFVLAFVLDRYSKWGRERCKRIATVHELPLSLIVDDSKSVRMGIDQDLGIPVYLPDALRSKHVHIIGATGSGKTESVILNFLRQDVERGIGSIILDAKGDISFLNALEEWVPSEKLKIFDLGDESSLTYNPIEAGLPLEAAQRLFSSLTWSEEYYKSKAFSALQKLFQHHFETHGRNPYLAELASYLDNPATFSAFIQTGAYPEKMAEKDFSELSGLRDQINILCSGHLKAILSPSAPSQISLTDVNLGCVLYFRLQSLLSPQLVSTMGKLLINHLSFLAGTAHRSEATLERGRIVPTYLDEFASFACPEFADLISKARSAGLALHFSHQSIGDLVAVSDGFLSQITDNSATKIVLRINDPDSAEFFARSFGTRLFQKTTQRITNAKEIDRAEVLGEGTQREAHQFRASPDLFKTLPTGFGSVLIAHGLETPHGASSVFKIKFPKLETKEERK